MSSKNASSARRIRLLASVLATVALACHGPPPAALAPPAGKACAIHPDDSGSTEATHDDVRLPEPALPPPASTTVVVVGAGLAGLTTAYRLRQAGIDAIVLEASPRIGGRIDSIHFADCSTAEARMEEYFERSPAVPLLRELGLPVVADVAHSSVRLGGTLYPYRGSGDRDTYLRGIFDDAEERAFLEWNGVAWSLYQRLHAWQQAETERVVAAGPALPLPPELQALTTVTFQQFVSTFRVSGGAALPAKVADWIRVTVEPEMAVEWDQISALDGIDEFRLFLDTPDGFGERNYHVRGGNIRFVQALAGRLPEGSIRTESPVDDLAQDAGGVVVSFSHAGTGYRVRAGYAVVTAPLFAFGAIRFTPALSSGRRTAIDTMGFGTFVKVHYRVDPGARATWERYGDDVFTLLSDSPAGTVYETSEFQERDPKAPLTLTSLIHARFAKPLLGLPKAEVALRARGAMDALFPGFSAHVLDTATYVYPTAVAYWPFAKGRSRFDGLADELRRADGRVYIGGDTTEDSHSEGAVQAADRMARAIALRVAGKAPTPP